MQRYACYKVMRTALTYYVNEAVKLAGKCSYYDRPAEVFISLNKFDFMKRKAKRVSLSSNLLKRKRKLSPRDVFYLSSCVLVFFPR